MNAARLTVLLLFLLLSGQAATGACLPEEILQLDLKNLRGLPLLSNGRIKPLESFAREAVLFIHGKYTLKLFCNDQKLVIDNPIASYFAVMANSEASFIEVRNPSLRKTLGLKADMRFASFKELKNASLNKDKKDTLELFRQMQLVESIMTGEHLMSAMQYTLERPDQMRATQSQIQMMTMDLLKTILQPGKNADSVKKLEKSLALSDYVKTLKFESTLERFRGAIPVELFYNRAQPFCWAAILFVCLGFVFIFVSSFIQSGGENLLWMLASLPVLIQIVGIVCRVWITGFSPVTNMFGTMIWVSLGAALFALLLFKLYKNKTILGLVFITSGVALLFTHHSPLMLSPDMDPIAAVLRSNFWLSTHVLTVTISYAAFTIAMVIGNAALIRQMLGLIDQATIKEYSHFCYRMIQLGVFLLTTGIILGGVWADYSWGRFWGWDPKETWALIADLGYIALLHARLLGWVDAFALLLWSPIAYLLVLMAWYGVNFILASGLHSYGFSSGGTAFVVTFVVIQLVIVTLALAKKKYTKTPVA